MYVVNRLPDMCYLRWPQVFCPRYGCLSTDTQLDIMYIVHVVY